MTESKQEIQMVPGKCSTYVNETVCVQADITIKPNVKVGHIESFCVGRPVIGACEGTPVEECTFSVGQNICVQIPLTFSVDTLVVPKGVACGTPAVGKCRGGSC